MDVVTYMEKAEAAQVLGGLPASAFTVARRDSLIGLVTINQKPGIRI